MAGGGWRGPCPRGVVGFRPRSGGGEGGQREKKRGLWRMLLRPTTGLPQPEVAYGVWKQREMAAIDPGAAELQRLRDVQVPGEAVPDYVAPGAYPLPAGRLPGITFQYCLRLPRCLWCAPLFGLVAQVLWHPGVVGARNRS
eukprot:COSAG02_NODE_1167_length_14137_cov_25.567175_10_plen_141_part_00